ncbi:HEAT repeat domain-containing protein [Streptomyces sp. CC219B]|uniref:HEAT repeat domain-containing protein n=1 Tax=Streptomyces sp. CC219B TaxID=3044574 RepID=UPI0024A98FA3|nr:HEAT repeat domain-containing protein [Streptomyces sp. CC219B]
MEIDDAPNMGYLLGAMESEDVEVREAALGWLSSAPWRDDDLAVATARAVPELARLAHRLPGHRADLLSLLSGIAVRDEWPDGADPAQPAVAAELPSLLPFAHDDDPEVRDALLPLLVTCRPPQALPLLRTRLAEEPDPAVRGHVVTALALLEPGEGGWRHELLADPEPKVRLAAAEDLLRTTAPPFPPGLVDACAQAYAARPHDLDEAHLAPAPHRRFADRLLDDPEAALRATAGGVPLAFEIAEHWRDREIEVLPWALRDLQDYYEDLDQLGRLCCVLPAELHARVRERVRPYLDRDFALRAAAVAALARAHAPEAVEEAVRLVEEEPFPPVPPGPHRVVRAVEAVAEVFGPGALPVARAVARRVGRGHADLIRVLEHYPEVALEVVDEVAALVPRYESGHAWAAITLLGALGPAAGDGAARALRDEATQGCHSSVAVYAAVAHHRVSGDPGLALSLLEREGPASWPEFAGGLGPAAGPLLPYLEARLAPGDPVGAGSAAARAIWQITGRTEDTLEPLARCAAADNHHTRRIASVTALTEMGLLPRFAVAPLRAAAESPRRVVRDLGDRSGLHPDYRLRTAVRTLLATAEVIDARD